MSSGFQRAQSASVTRPDSLQNTFGLAARRRSWVAQGSRRPAFMSGLAMWSSTKALLGKALRQLDRRRELPGKTRRS